MLDGIVAAHSETNVSACFIMQLQCCIGSKSISASEVCSSAAQDVSLTASARRAFRRSMPDDGWLFR
jgi:hypothetical protein